MPIFFSAKVLYSEVDGDTYKGEYFNMKYCIFSVIKWPFFLPKQSKNLDLSYKKPPNTLDLFLEDRSRSSGLFRKGKTCITAKFHRTDLIICSHSRERKPLSYS